MKSTATWAFVTHSRPVIHRRLISAGAAATLLCLAATSIAQDARGPAFGSNKFSTEIRSPLPGEADVDDYVASLMAGESLNVTVSVGKKEALVPSLTLIDPDGIDRTAQAGVAVKKAGKKLLLKKFAIDKTGTWTVRVGGDPEGAYTVAFKIRGAKPIKLKKQTLGGATLERTHAIPGVDGALATITVKYSKKEAAVAVRGLTDPSGAEVPGVAGDLAGEFVAKGTKLSVKKVPLSSGDGDYGLTLGIDSDTATYNLTAKVVPQGRPKGKIQLSPDEPFLTAAPGGLRGITARPISIDGANFSRDPVPQVFFGDAAGTVTSVALDGSSLVVQPPLGVEGATVDVVVVNPDGQAAARDDFFLYVPLPTVDSLVDAAGDPLVGGSSQGGQAARLIGTGFETGQTVRLGTAGVQMPVVVSDTEFTFVTPASGGDGTVLLALTDNFGRVVQSAFEYRYKAPPVFAGSPSATYAPSVGVEAGGTVVTVTGSNFQLTDVLLFDDVEITHTRLSDTQLRFTSPAKTPGQYPVSIRDEVGTTVVGPLFTVKAAPTVSSVEAFAGPFVDGTPDRVALGGGTSIRITGTNFAASDSVTLDGVAVTPTLSNATTIEFVTAAHAAGEVDLSVQDGAGQGATITAALRYIGFAGSTADRSPGATGDDDLTATRGAIGDLDGDGDEDDLVIVSPTLDSPGDRDSFTRILFGDENGAMVDVTDDNFPAVYDDRTGTDRWNSNTVALGDIDGRNGPDIVIVKQTYYDSDNTGYYYAGVRVMTNDGYGEFSYASDPSPDGTYYYRDTLYAEDQDSTEYAVFSYYGTFSGADPEPTSVAIGDLDDDGTLDVVVGMDKYSYAYSYVDPAYVDFEADPIYAYNASAYLVYQTSFIPAVRVFFNDHGLDERSARVLPLAGFQGGAAVPAFHSRDIALGDVDGDDSLDIVVTWDDPQTVSAYGMYYGAGSDVNRIATRILLNDGNGFFADGTDDWMPAGSGDEFWQGDRLALVDITGDAALDLVILHAEGPTASTSALRILRNDGDETGFTDVSATLLPALPQSPDDNYRGTALSVHDADGDGDLDILIGHRRGLTDANEDPIRGTRFLRNDAGTFVLANAFLPAVDVDSGESDDLLFLDDLAGSTEPVLLSLTEVRPTNSASGESLRLFDWSE